MPSVHMMGIYHMMGVSVNVLYGQWVYAINGVYIYMICIYIYIHYMDVSEHRVYLQKQSEFNRGIGWTWWFFTIFGVIHFQTSDIAIMVCGCLKWGIRPEWTLNLGQHGQTGMVWTPVGNTLNWPHKVGVSRIEWGATIQKVRVTKK